MTIENESVTVIGQAEVQSVHPLRFALYFITGSRLALIILLVILSGTSESYKPSPARDVGLEYKFSITKWEISNLPKKWLNLVYWSLPGRSLDEGQRKEIIDEYIQATRLARRQELSLERLEVSSGAVAAGSAGPDRVKAAMAYLAELTKSRDKLKPLAEEIIETEIDSVLKHEGFGSRIGILLPPVDLKFEGPPTVLTISSRDHIEVKEQIMLMPDVPVLERDRLERELMDRYDYSAFVDDLSGLSTYPTLVSDQAPMRSILRTAAHEWIHAYLFFRPLGWNWRKSPDMFSLNETIAEIAGNELGDKVFAGMGGDLSLGASRYSPRHQRDDFFTKEMRETRHQVEILLGDNKIEEAEYYMKMRWWRLRLGGYRLRKLNQAYFAFRGRYAEGPASVSPIGSQVRALREVHPDVTSFVKTVEGVSSYQEFLVLLARMDINPSRD